MTPDEYLAIRSDFINLINEHKNEIIIECSDSHLIWCVNNYPHTLSVNGYKFLKQFSFYVVFIQKMKQKQINKNSIPYCMNVFNKFVRSDFAKQLCLRATVISDVGLRMLFIYFTNKYTQFEYRCNVVVENEMLHDDEFAWACFYDLDAFQQFQPFIDYKNNYLLRKERLLVVHEELYNNYKHSNAINMVFANDFLIRTIMRFL